MFWVFGPALGGACYLHPEAAVFWRWLAWCGHAPGQQPPLYVNMDETSVAVVQQNGTGAVVTASTPGGVATLAPKASLSERRAAVTCISVVCDDAVLQPKLPQLIVAARRLVTKKLKESIKFPGSVTLLAEKSAWNNSAIMLKFLSMLAEALKEHVGTRRIVLIMDVARCHLSQMVLDHARHLNIWLVLVPAGATPYLQPLDATVFKGFKAYLRRGYARIQVASATGSVSHKDFLELLAEAATKHLCSHKWAPAFRQVGAGTTGLQQLSSDLRRFVKSWDVEAKPPSSAELGRIFPKGKRPCPTSFASLPRRRLCAKTSI